MSPTQLLTHFNRISEGPDALPALRRFVLDVAVKGKLSRRDPNDEPASVLLERIKVERAAAALPTKSRAKKPRAKVTL